MGSFKSAAAQAISGQATLLPEHRPAKVVPGDWLQPGEWIVYWSEVPYGLAADIAEVATVATVDQGSGNRAQRRNQSAKVNASYKAGRASIASFISGIVNWNLTDENGLPVPFVAINFDEPEWFSRGKAIMSALPVAVVNSLQELIDSGSPPPLTTLVEEPEYEDETEGNASGAS